MAAFDNGETTPKSFECEFCGAEGPHAMSGHMCDYDDLLTIVSESKAKVATLEQHISAHNEAVIAACEARGCEAYTARGLQCPACPKDYLIED